MNEEEFKALVAKVEKATGEKITEEVKNQMKDLDVAKVNELLKKDVATTEDVQALKSLLDGANESIAEMKDNFSSKTFGINHVEKEVMKFIEENHDEIKRVHKNKHGVLELTIKAPELITTGAATNPDGIPELVGTQMAPATNVNLRDTFVMGLVSNFNTSLAAYPYTETLPKDGDFAFVAEGAVKPQIDLKIETRYAQPVKAAAWMKLTDEAVQDIRGMQSIATDYLRKKHNLKKQNGILFGDGISPNPKGATTYGRAFVAGDMATSVTNPNFMDVVNAAATDIYTTQNYEDEMAYIPTLVLINPVDFYLQLVSAKDGDGKPLYPTASLFNRVNIGGMTIMPERDIPSGKIFVADMSKYNVTDYVGYTVQIGWVNDDFIKNQFVILGESRFHAFVRKLDEQAFLYDDIATIKTAITAV